MFSCLFWIVILQYIRRGMRDTIFLSHCGWFLPFFLFVLLFHVLTCSDYSVSSPAVRVALPGNEMLHGVIRGIEVSPLTTGISYSLQLTRDDQAFGVRTRWNGFSTAAAGANAEQTEDSFVCLLSRESHELLPLKNTRWPFGFLCVAQTQDLFEG